MGRMRTALALMGPVGIPLMLPILLTVPGRLPWIAHGAEPADAASPLSERAEDPVDAHGLSFSPAPTRWHLGLPLANGEVGVMVWGGGQPLILTLDRYDLWESRTWRPDPLRYNYDRWRKLIEEGRYGEIREEFETRHWAARDRGEVPSPTRLPLGRLELRLGGGAAGGAAMVRRADLDLRRAEARLECGHAGESNGLEGGNIEGGSSEAGTVRVLVHATMPTILVEVEGDAAEGLRWALVPARLSEGESRRLERLGYAPPRVRAPETAAEDGAEDGTSADRTSADRTSADLTWRFGGNREVAVLARAVELGPRRTILALSIRTAAAGPERPAQRRGGPAPAGPRPGGLEDGPPASAARDLASAARDLAVADVDRALSGGEDGWRARLEEHRRWWAEHWKVSSIRIPDAKLEALWVRGMYQLASLSRPGKYPISLQGVWSKDGGLPPWAGDYHLDMNLQESYWPVYASNHLPLGQPLYDRFFENLPRYRRMAREFFGFDGCYTRCEQALDGSEIFGYATTNFWAGNGAWLAHHFWLHWRYSLDFDFLANRAFPFLRSCLDLYLGLLEKGDDGAYHIPVTNSPEFHENGDAAWGRDDAGNLALVRFLCEACLQADRILGREDPARDRWEDVLAHLAPLPGTARDPSTGETIYRPNQKGGLLVMADRPYDMPHRHMTHLLAIYPLCLLRKGTSRDVDLLIDDSLDHVLALNRPIGDWAGWTFPWVSLLASHAGRPSLAVEMLHRYADAHTYPNGLHENGDWRGLGTTRLRYGEPTVTLEAGLAAAAAVMDLLIQSDGGRIRLFPAVPPEWKDASFERLRAEGAFVVSAELRGGRLSRARILGEKGGTCRIAGLQRRPSIRSSRGAPPTVDLADGVASFASEPGETYELEP